VFWHPNGWTIYTTLQDYMRRRQRAGGYVEVNTPQVVNRKLWEKSGHWENYQENMFIVEVDEEGAREKRINALKPMNCPCHVQIFNHGLKATATCRCAWPNSGPATAMSPRARCTASCGCAASPRTTRISSAARTRSRPECALHRLSVFGLCRSRIREVRDQALRPGPKSASARTRSGTRPRPRWNAPSGRRATISRSNPGEGAFYGPKLEFVLTDAIGRDWQCGTLQADFNLPERLDAEYVGEDGAKHRPVMLHRATLGSFERFIGILIEKPRRQAALLAGAASGRRGLDRVGRRCLCMRSSASCAPPGCAPRPIMRNEKINYKVREHSVGKVPVILAIGDGLPPRGVFGSR
jgi:threonyl-tRNA synthetase